VRVVLNKRVSVGHERQVSWLTDKLASNKWPTGHLECEMAADNDRSIRLSEMVFIDWGKRPW
jgi:hypothetical protein